MRRRSVESSAIESVGYDARSRILEIEYAGGGVYRYVGVPQRAYELLLRAESHGVYVNRRIKPFYRALRVAT
ncbi:MAG TPA: KTSC domain-containing protein [Conexibacter sp.]